MEWKWKSILDRQVIPRPVRFPCNHIVFLEPVQCSRGDSLPGDWEWAGKIIYLFYYYIHISRQACFTVSRLISWISEGNLEPGTLQFRVDGVILYTTVPQLTGYMSTESTYLFYYFIYISRQACFASAELVKGGWTGNLAIPSWCYYPLHHRATVYRLDVTRGYLSILLYS